MPFEFVVGNRAFPPGTYIFEMATGSPKVTAQAGVLMVRSGEPRLYTAVATGVAVDAHAHVQPKLAFTRTGDHEVLSKVWRPGNTEGFSVPVAQGATQTENHDGSEVLVMDATTTSGGM